MCDCIKETNELLAGYNAAILTNMLGPARTFVSTYKRDEKKRGKPPLLQATFCPFCGERYVAAQVAPSEEEHV